MNMKKVEWFGQTYLAEVTDSPVTKMAPNFGFFGGSGSAFTEVQVAPCKLFFVKPRTDAAGEWVFGPDGVEMDADGQKEGQFWLADNGRVFAAKDFDKPVREEPAF